MATATGKKDSLFVKVWWPLIALAVVTILEFVVAFNVEARSIRVPTFIIMTILKAYYIVAYFMHMRYEVNLLRWFVIGTAVALIIYLVIFLVIEAYGFYHKFLLLSGTT